MTSLTGPYRALFDLGFARVDPERAHRAGFAAVRAGAPLLRGFARVSPMGSGGSSGAPVHAMGLEFPHPLGLAAGFDKNAEGVRALAALGFGHVEIGTVTGQAQPGNPRPRLFRLRADRAVVNRMGFNNDGADVVARRLARLGFGGGARRPGDPVLGVNIGKTKVVPEDDQAAVEDDYHRSASALAPYADYLVVNVSSPNTPGLRTLQAVDRLGPLLARVRTSAEDAAGRRVPLVVKIAPDLTDEQVREVADLAVAAGLDGISATNTTISRAGLRSPDDQVEQIGAGGLSGPPVRARATEVVRLLRERVGPDLTLIGVGGITTAEDARARLDAGADLIQAYTAFIYEGPRWPRRIVAGLATGERTHHG